MLATGKTVLEVGAFRCGNCHNVEKVIQKGDFVTAPIKCGECGKEGPWTYIPELSAFTPR